MRFFNWFSPGSGTNRSDERSRAVAGEQITINEHEAEKARIQNWITERKALAAAKRPELSSEGARYWLDHYEGEEINRLEQLLQWNESYIIHARNNILYHQQQARR